MLTAKIVPSKMTTNLFQNYEVEIYDGRQLKKIVRNGFSLDEAIKYCEFDGLELLAAKP